MLLKAAKDWNIDLGRSYMIGDTERDILAGRNAGCKESVMIETNSSNALLLAIKQILNK